MLCGKTAFITGCNRGIGKAIAEKFVQNGADVIAHARAQSNDFESFLDSLARQHGVSARPVYFDMTDYDAMRQAVRALIRDKVPVHVLVNNAGVAHGGFFQMTPVAKIREVFEVNFFAQLELTQMLLRYMGKCGGGSIVNMASTFGMDLLKGNCAYGTSKAALIAFTQTLATEYPETGVRVNAVAPTVTDTDMIRQLDGKVEDMLLQRCAMNRKATPEEVADAVLYLASDRASFVNGQILRVDGRS